MKKKILSVIAGVICLVSISLAVRPLFEKMYIPTHDGEYHIIRIIEFSKMLTARYWFPRWAPDLNSGFGVPIFNFHYPLPNYIGSFLRIFTRDAVAAYKISEGLGYIAAVVFAFLWLHTIFGVYAAAIGTTVSAFVPYWFVDMYVRGTIGEIWAMAFLFAVLYFVETKKYIKASYVFAFLILSHNILAILFAPFIFGYIIIRDRKALKIIAFGLGLSAFFWLPAFLEQRYVVGLNTVNFREHFAQLYELLIPSWGTEFSGSGLFANKISFQIGIIPFISYVLSAAVFIKMNEKSIRNLYAYFAVFGLFAVFFITSYSRPIWEMFPVLSYIQYPWRLLSFVTPTSAFAAAFWTYKYRMKWTAIILASFAVLLGISYAHPVQYTQRDESYYLARPNFIDGTSSMGNSFSTIWTGRKEKRADAPVSVIGGIFTGRKSWNYLDKTISVVMASKGVVTFNTLYFPGWSASIDDRQVPIDYAEDGIIHITVPAGDNRIRIWFKDTEPRIIGNVITLISLVITVGWGILSIYAYRNRRITA